ncbi:Arc family DNA-binding protein [Bacteroides heparinolyticus]|uniref:Arc family DNA-binding protein n=1 Tax=Prevotella heparinolytica TaxID=28113 RepID=UPI00359FF617
MGEIYRYPLKIDAEVMDGIKALAEEHSRSVNKEIEFALKQYIKAHTSQEKD